MKVNKKKVIKEVAKINSVELCSIDMLVRVDEYNGKFFACDGCIFKDTGKFILIYHYKLVDNHGGVVC